MLTLLFYNPLRVKALRGIFVPISIDRHPKKYYLPLRCKLTKERQNNN
jgi:hypothetical protein|nr:MAG TPA: hypothetical protein [Caudoviricetes sp.]